MPRLPQLAPADPDSPAAAILAETERQLGRTPNLYRAMANSPGALGGYLAFRGALQSGALTTVQRELIALRVAEVNDCDYCVAAHTMRAGRLRVSEEDLMATRAGRHDDLTAEPLTRHVLAFTDAVVQTRGAVSGEALERARAAGLTDELIVEITAHVALNVYSNYVARLVEPDLDFTPAPALASAR